MTRVSTHSDDEKRNNDVPRQLLALLGDEDEEATLPAPSRTAKSADTVSEELDVARSTIYGRVEEMLAYDIIVE